MATLRYDVTPAKESHEKRHREYAHCAPHPFTYDLHRPRVASPCYGGKPMQLLTVARLREEAPPPTLETSGALTVTRRGIGIRLWDVVLLCAPRTPLSSGVLPREVVGGDDALAIAALLRRGSLAVATVGLPGDRAAHPSTESTKTLGDTRAVVLVVPERTTPGGTWLWWAIGWLEARGVRLAVLPLPRRDEWMEVSSFPALEQPALATLPYLGIARAVGEEAPTLWVAPAGARLDTREAVNFEYWLHDRH